MKILLDTHVFLWWDSNPEKLVQGVMELLTNSENSIFLSVASAWEIQIKKQLGKLALSIPLFSTGQILIAAQFSWIFNREGAKDAKENDENFAHFAASRLNFKVCPVENPAG